MNMPFELSEGYGKDFSTLRNVFSKVEKLFFLTKPQSLFYHLQKENKKFLRNLKLYLPKLQNYIKVMETKVARE